MHKVKCFYCQEIFDADIEPYEKVNARRYAHEECYFNNHKTDDDFIDLIYFYLKDEIFIGLEKAKNWWAVCDRQRKDFLAKNPEYSNEGIYYSLKYYYEVKRGSAVKSEGRIGIVPYVYEDAQDYFKGKELKNKILTQAFKKYATQNCKIEKIIIRQKEILKKDIIDMNSLLMEEEC
jgi:hypothetical protein